MTNYELYLASVLAVLGLFLQYLRAFRWFNDLAIAALAVVLAASGYVLCHAFGSDFRLEAILALIALPGNTAAVLGGTFVGAKAGNAGVVLPRTNSIGGTS